MQNSPAKLSSKVISNSQVEINNEIYNQLGQRWYEAYDDPVALLRAESQLTGAWVQEKIQQNFGNKLMGPNLVNNRSSRLRILDIGCGGGFVTNPLARFGYDVTGVDLSAESLEVAKKYDSTRSVKYLLADANQLPFEGEQFDVVSAMDFLEHVENPQAVIQEVQRVLKPGGLFFFHTFNRNPIAGLVIIKFVEWFVKNTPKHMHLLRMFIKPREMNEFCQQVGMEVQEMRGTKPNLFNLSFFKAIPSRTVPKDFSFSFSRWRLLAYAGYAKKVRFS